MLDSDYQTIETVISILTGVLSIAILVTFFIIAYRLKQIVYNTKKDVDPGTDNREQRVIDSFVEARINELSGFPQEALKHYIYCYYNFYRSPNASFQIFGESISSDKLKKKIESLAGRQIIEDRKSFAI